MTVNDHNDRLVENLATYFPLKRSLSTAWGNVGSLYMMLPGLRGFWPMSAVGGSGEALDLSGNALHLTNNNNLNYTIRGPRTYASFSTTGPKYLSRADEAAFDVGGSAAWDHGLTMGCWFRLGATTTVSRTIMGKWDAATNNRSYVLQLMSDERVCFMISNDGTTIYQIIAPRVLSTASGRWVFIAGTFDDTADVAGRAINIYVSDGTDLIRRELQNLSVPSTLYNSTADFTIGASHGGVDPIANTSNMMLAFLTCIRFEHGTLDTLFNLSRPWVLRYPKSNF